MLKWHALSKTACDNVATMFHHHPERRLLYPAGSALAALAGAAVAVLLWCFLWRNKRLLSSKPYQFLPGMGNILAGQRNCTHASDASELDAQTHITILSDSSEAAKTVNTGSSLHTADARSETGGTNSLSDHSLHAATAKTQTCSEGTVFYTSRPVMTEVTNLRPIGWPCLQPVGQMLLIPAPLWQDVEIHPDNISIAQTSAGSDWILGQGSYGMVSFNLLDYMQSCLFLAGSLCLVMLTQVWSGQSYI